MTQTQIRALAPARPAAAAAAAAVGAAALLRAERDARGVRAHGAHYCVGGVPHPRHSVVTAGDL
jgi:hypothetical protein